MAPRAGLTAPLTTGRLGAELWADLWDDYDAGVSTADAAVMLPLLRALLLRPRPPTALKRPQRSPQ
jgi:hypothetical protein